MRFDISHEGKTTLGTDYDRAVALGYPIPIIAGSLKLAAKRLLDDYQENFARQVQREIARGVILSAGFEVCRIIAGIGENPDDADAAELALVDRIAAARDKIRADVMADAARELRLHRTLELFSATFSAEGYERIDAVEDLDEDIVMTLESVLNAIAIAQDAEFAALLAPDTPEE